MPGKILVTGATGNVGGGVVASLTAMGANVRALVHEESKAQGLRDTGVEVVVGDLNKPETRDAAFSGVDRVFLATPVSPDQVSMARNAIAAAKRAGSPHIVRLSADAQSLEGETDGRHGRRHKPHVAPGAAPRSVENRRYVAREAEHGPNQATALGATRGLASRNSFQRRS